MEHTLAALFGQSLTLFIEGSPSAGAVGPPPTLAGQVWSLSLFSPAAPGGCSPSVFLLRLLVALSPAVFSCLGFFLWHWFRLGFGDWGLVLGLPSFFLGGGGVGALFPLSSLVSSFPTLLLSRLLGFLGLFAVVFLPLASSVC